MKVVRIHSYGGSDQIRVEDADRPKIKNDQVLVKIRDAGINPFDWKVREGYAKDFAPAKFPLTLGQDFSGEVIEVGSPDSKFKVGDEVFGFAPGSYAEYAAVRPDKIARKPKSVDFVTAASLPTAGLTAWQIVNDVARVTKDQLVFIQGAGGGVGAFAVQLAKLKGARIVATASREDAEYLRGLGAEHVIDYRSEKFEVSVKDADCVIDLVGGKTLDRSYQVIKPGGILVTTVGSINEAELKSKSISGVDFVMKPDAQGLADLVRLVEQGTLKPRVALVVPLHDAKKGQDLNQSGESHGKVVLKVA